MRIWTLAETGRIEAHVAAISFSNCYYIVRGFAGRKAADDALRLLRTVFRPVDFTSHVLNQAMDSGFEDFEDAIQYHSATHAQAECLVTRDAKHFPRVTLPALSPAEFLTSHTFQ